MMCGMGIQRHGDHHLLRRYDEHDDDDDFPHAESASHEKWEWQRGILFSEIVCYNTRPGYWLKIDTQKIDGGITREEESQVKPCKKTIKNASRTVKGSQHGSRPKNQFKINVKCLDPRIYSV